MKNFVEPTVEIIELENSDIITASGGCITDNETEPM